MMRIPSDNNGDNNFRMTEANDTGVIRQHYGKATESLRKAKDVYGRAHACRARNDCRFGKNSRNATRPWAFEGSEEVISREQSPTAARSAALLARVAFLFFC
jgi:hypothetical protein